MKSKKNANCSKVKIKDGKLLGKEHKNIKCPAFGSVYDKIEEVMQCCQFFLKNKINPPRSLYFLFRGIKNVQSLANEKQSAKIIFLINK